jgi:heme exporter protein A
MLTCQNISVRRNSQLLFANLGFTLFPGSCLFVRGRNGIGKSTLLKVIANLLPKDNGEIFFNAINVKLVLDEFYSLLSYIGKSEILDEEQTVLKNLEFWAALYKQEMNIAAAIHTFSLEPYINTEVFKLSQGFRQRVLLARLLLNNARLWLLDEPLNGLDMEACEIFRNLIKARCMQNGIVVIVTHDANFRCENSCEINLEDFCDE